MANFVYETHTMKNPLLPFIFKSFTVTQRHSMPNWHENIELLRCTAGKGFVRCGMEIFEFAKGDLFVVNANTPHSICSEGSVAYRCLIVDNDFFLGNGIPVTRLHFQNCIRDEKLNALFDAVGEAFSHAEEPQVFGVAEVRYGVLALLRHLCTHYIVSKPAGMGSAANEHVKKAITYIRKNLTRPIILDEIAADVGVSKFHLSREFKAFTGKTIVQTVNLIRCNEAKRRIDGGMSVSAAAAECGFENLSYFSRTFKKQYGSLPSAFLQTTASHSPMELDLEEADCY